MSYRLFFTGFLEILIAPVKRSRRHEGGLRRSHGDGDRCLKYPPIDGMLGPEGWGKGRPRAGLVV